MKIDININKYFGIFIPFIRKYEKIKKSEEKKIKSTHGPTELNTGPNMYKKNKI